MKSKWITLQAAAGVLGLNPRTAKKLLLATEQVRKLTVPDGTTRFFHDDVEAIVDGRIASNRPHQQATDSQAVTK